MDGDLDTAATGIMVGIHLIIMDTGGTPLIIMDTTLITTGQIIITLDHMEFGGKIILLYLMKI